jgi:hypothetical protein
VLNLAREKIPTDPEIWIAASMLQVRLCLWLRLVLFCVLMLCVSLWGAGGARQRVALQHCH